MIFLAFEDLLKHKIVDRDIGKTPEMAKKCSVHPKFVGKSEKGVPNLKKKQSGLS